MSSHESSAATTEIAVASKAGGKEMPLAPKIGSKPDYSPKATAKSMSESKIARATSANAAAATGTEFSGVFSTETRKPAVRSTNPEAKESRAATRTNAEETVPKIEENDIVGETKTDKEITDDISVKETCTKTATKAEADETSTNENADESKKPMTWVDPNNPANFIPPGWMSREEYDKKRKIVEVGQRKRFAAIEPKEVLALIVIQLYSFSFEKTIVLNSLTLALFSI